ncbi:MAG: adenine deaminase C-terminal domain-containing protein, partial [Anaerolineae bacterium]
IDEVYCDGVLVAKDGDLVVDLAPYAYPAWAVASMHLDPLDVEDFRVAVDGEGPMQVRVMRAVPGMVHTEEQLVEMRPVEGALEADPERDLAKAAVFYRHAPKPGATGTRTVGFVTGLGFDADAAFASSVSHDCHNLLVIGTDDSAMVTAANAVIEMEGGMAVVVDGEVAARLALPLGGLMALAPAAEVARELEGIEAGLRAAGCPHASAEMTISLLGLIVIEELHLSNRGLVALRPGEAPAFVELVVG